MEMVGIEQTSLILSVTSYYDWVLKVVCHPFIFNRSQCETFIEAYSFCSHTLNILHPLSDAQLASTRGPSSSSLKGRQASFLIAPMWQ